MSITSLMPPAASEAGMLERRWRWRHRRSRESLSPTSACDAPRASRAIYVSVLLMRGCETRDKRPWCLKKNDASHKLTNM